MIIQRLSDLAWMAQGAYKINQSQVKIICDKCNHVIGSSSILQPIMERFNKSNPKESHFEHDPELRDVKFEMTDEDISGAAGTKSHFTNGTADQKREFSTYGVYSKSPGPRNPTSMFGDTSHRTFHTSFIRQAITADEMAKVAELANKRKSGTRNIPKSKASIPEQKLSSRSRERRVPSSRISRVASFGGLAAGMMMGTVSDMAKKSLGFSEKADGGQDGFIPTNSFTSEANLERIVNTLCRVRGAALKLGQMLSIQDESIINPKFLEVFERVRQSADFMPVSQMKKVLVKEFGPDWNEKLSYFEERPFAAASIGQVHRGVLHDGREVAIKIQYPGVADSINSDISNLVTLMKMWNVFPEQFFLDKFISVARKELSLECDYLREAEYSRKFKELLKDDGRYHIPEVIPELSSKQVLTTELIWGMPLDQVKELDQETRNFVASAMLNLLLRELFEFRSMQTDPNWSNFFYNDKEKKIYLLDFGASRDYRNEFVDEYIEVVRAASIGDRQTVLEKSRKLQFLTGYETKVMEEAHIDAVMILGEPFAKDEPFDFGTQNTTKRIARLVPTMLEHRLTAPPEETYSIHRKLSGGFLLAAKLRSKFSCKNIFDSLYQNHHAQKQNS